jgi:hypothetical protein
MSNNVVFFPKTNRNIPPQTLEQLMVSVEETRKEHAEYILDETLSFLFARCQEEGFDITNETCCKITALFVESYKSALYKSVGIEHPLQEVAEHFFVEESEANKEEEKPIVETE